MSEFKTNVMRMLDKAKVKYNHYSYADTDAVSGTEVAAVLHQNPERVFKTLVTLAKSGNHYVFMIPVEKELDLKKAAVTAVLCLTSGELLSSSSLFLSSCSTA